MKKINQFYLALKDISEAASIFGLIILLFISVYLRAVTSKVEDALR